MIPEQRLSTQNLPSPFVFPIPRDNQFEDFELAGVGLNDPSQGRQVQLWRLVYDEDTGEFILSAPNYPPTVQFVRADVSYVSLSFDNNMNPFISFTESGISKFWWFDPLVSQQVFDNTTIATAVSPYATVDDLRPIENSQSDIILAYIRAGNLYFRAQRDRYTIEYFLRSGVTGQVLTCGMGINLRFQILVGAFL
jgi:hypothetical protein